MTVPIEAPNRVDQLLSDLLQVAFECTVKRSFLSEADRVERELRRALASAYDDELRGRLLALRLVNLVLARYHFHHRHSAVASRPVQLMLDPVNNCHLSCPGCLHTSNPRFANTFDWPGGILAPETHEQVLSELGPTAWGVVYYNWGEPLLGKKTPELIRRAKRYLLHTCLSTNLSVRFDADALVASGLNFLFLSIDGATQNTYAKFRRGGDIALCFENIARLVEARSRQGSRTPFLLWRYLTFEHNLHEVDEAFRLARELGIDQFSVTTPFAVDWDDREIRAATSSREGAYPLRNDASFRGPLDEWRGGELAEEEIVRESERSWIERLGDDPATLDEPSRPSSAACWWLYQSLTLDARARLFPCCMAPEKDRHKVYGDFAAANGNAFNVRDLRQSRLSFADSDAFRTAHAAAGGGIPPYCAECWEKPEMTYTLARDVARDARLAEPLGLVSAATTRALTEWPVSR